jgi:lactoylglutathione lyase
MKPATNYLQLELHVPDFKPVKDYYGKLGFEIVWERTPEAEKGYLVIKRDEVTLCFWCGTDAVYDQPYFKRFPNDTVRGYGVEVVIMVGDIDTFYEQVKDGANVVEPLVTQPWGLKDFRTADPFGYYLRFTSKHNILDNANAVE